MLFILYDVMNSDFGVIICHIYYMFNITRLQKGNARRKLGKKATLELRYSITIVNQKNQAFKYMVIKFCRRKGSLAHIVHVKISILNT